jgi:hypothetical protein
MLYIILANGQLIGIKVYSALGLFISVNGIRFLYNTSVKHILGFVNNALLAFILDRVKRLVKVIAYKRGSIILYLEASPLFQLLFLCGYCRGADLSQKKRPYRNDTRKPSNGTTSRTHM